MEEKLQNNRCIVFSVNKLNDRKKISHIAYKKHIILLYSSQHITALTAHITLKVLQRFQGCSLICGLQQKIYLFNNLKINIP